MKLYERESVIIFDEIQKSPETRQAIKYLVKDHRYDYIETGSLLGEALRNRQPLGEAVCRKLMRDFRLYMLVGGMPQAVNTYLDTINTDYSQYKMYVGDTGLFVTLAFWDKSITENIIYQKLLSDKLSANLGYVYENIVAQMLTATGNKLFYHTWPSETSNHNYEVDFIHSHGAKIWPIEVKSSGAISIFAFSICLEI